MEIHYSADPGKRAPEWKEVNSASIPRRDWLREYELSWETWEGLPVYADWDTKIHGNPKIIDPHLGLPLFRGWDFGLTPAAVVCQLQEEKLVAIKEFVGFNIGITRFSEIVLNQCKQLFPLFADLQRDWREIIDPAGFAKKDTDEKSCADVLKERRLNVMAGEIAFTKRKEAVESFLTRRTKDGPCLQVSLSECPMLVRGFKGGYQYPEYGADMKANELRPVKNEFSHIHDAFQMVASIFGKKSRKSGVSIRTPGYSSNRNYGYNKS